ncbi:L,D-transpeptidase family protein [Poseidonibacter ostreae]|jgi:L,D-transpeptidase YcbB|uniref:L,D-transpeptidase family protein n=2 Tax=Poseidonibacter ostreae TaxID=2654171 RepID=A0ABQ6VLW8_9BACT|nr:L,D-transpeptidase family protein [Poseidonibacter ostreae]KAB7883069.1 L,D-transpeptidase family protein [Poseidonibacter ostreae]KAB7888462.1 L,D-transpeptidase family protein [Poseidonibacter ostreae]
MYNSKFVLSALFLSSSLFATTDIKPSEIKQEVLNEKYVKVDNIAPSLEEIFINDSTQTVKKLLSYRKIPNSFLSKSSIKNYYKNFNNQLIWSDKNGIKDISITLLETIKNDPVLKPNIKKAFNLEKILKELTKLEKTDDKYLESMTKIDFMLTSIYDKYMRYLSKGYINWKGFKRELRKLDEKEEILTDWEKFNVNKNTAKLLKEAIIQNDLSFAFNEVNYTYPKAKELASTINDFEKLSLEGGYIKLPKFKKLTLGDTSDIVKILRERLLQSKDLKENTCDIQNDITPDTISQIQRKEDNLQVNAQVANAVKPDTCEVYDEDLKEAVISFQKNHGLLADGIVGPTTRKYLNISVESKIAKMRLNLERMRWLPRSLGEKYLLVNIPDYRLKMYENNEVKLDMKTVVGTRKNPTPIFSNEMSFIVLNPYWRIPPRIVKREIIPKLVKNPSYLDGRGIRLHENWDHNSAEFDLNSIDWSLYDENRVATTNITTTIVNGEEVQTEEVVEPEKGPTMRFIQIPSDKNPLGRMKFMFPNKYAVYLHDSPAKRYFNYTKRAYSHGCVRLAEPKELLKAIASRDDNLDFDKASNILEDIEKTQIGLKKKIPVHMVYLTSWVDENNNLQFRDDIYKYDKIQKRLMYKSNKYM